MSQPSMDVGPIAIVEDEPVIRRLMRLWLEADGFTVVDYGSGREIVKEDTKRFGAVCLDLQLEDMPGQSVLAHLASSDPDLPVIVATGDPDADTAAQAMRAGAYDYITKPFDRERLHQAVHRAMERRRLTASVGQLRRELGEHAAPSGIIGQSAPMQELTSEIERILKSGATIVLFGESGTGKELIARAIHRRTREGGPFVAVSCAAIPEALQETEIFGRREGALAEAGTRRGRLEQANGGTLFLDEVGEMSAAAQESLFRALSSRAAEPSAGSASPQIICATRRDLEALARAGRFREDLYAQLAVSPLRLPPLRARREDIPLLVAHFLRGFREDVGRHIERVTPEALDALASYSWPGNVRELQNVIHRAMLSSDGDSIKLSHLPSHIMGVTHAEVSSGVEEKEGPPSDVEGPVFDGSTLNLRELERAAIARALKLAGGSVGKAAKLLGIGRATLYRRLSEQRGPLNGNEADKLNGHEIART